MLFSPWFQLSGRFQIGDEVTVSIHDVDVLQQMQVNHGEWATCMVECINRPCKVLQSQGEDVLIRAPSGNVYRVSMDILSKFQSTAKSEMLKMGDEVKIIKDESKLKELQKNHGGWNDSMKFIIGAKGIVKEVYANGDLSVRIINSTLRLNGECIEGQQKDNDSGREMSNLLAQMFDQSDFTQGGVESQLSNIFECKLFVAVKSGDIKEARDLVRIFGPNVTKENVSILSLAIFGGHEDMVRFLLEEGATTSTKDPVGNYPVHLAVQLNRLRICKQLVEKGADVNARNDAQLTPLMLASAIGSKDILEYLVKVPSIDFNVGDENKDTALHLAIQNSRLDLVEILLEAGANIMTVNGKEFSSYHLAALRGHEKILEVFLKKAGATIVDLQKEDKFAALHLVALNNHPGCLRLLIRYNADINIRNGKLQTPLHIAVSQRYLECVKILVENKAEINLKDESGDTPLHDGIRACIIEDLKKNGSLFGLSDIFKLLDRGSTKKDDPEDIILYLVKNEAKFDIKNNVGETAMDLCNDEVLKAKLISVQEHNLPIKKEFDLSKVVNSGHTETELEELQKKIKKLEEEKLCMICWERPLDCTFECGHLSCESCADNLYECHICREKIGKIIKIYH